MQKKIIIIFFIFLTSVLLGTSTAGNIFFGDLNPIDEGQFAAWANYMLLGKQMYKDIYIVYGPLHVYPIYILFKIFSPSAFLVRFFLTVGSAVGIIAIYFILDEFRFSKLNKTIVLLVFLLVPATILRQGMGLWAIYVLMVAYSTKSKFWNFLLGIISVVTFLVSSDFGIFIFTVVLIHYTFQYIVSKKIIDVFFQNLFFLLGALTVCVLFFVWSYSEGWLLDYIRVTKDIYISSTGSSAPNGQNFPNPLTILGKKDLLSSLKYFFSKDMLLYESLIIYFVSIFYLFFTFFTNKTHKQEYKFFLFTLYGILTYSVLLTRHGIGHFFYVLPPIIISFGYFLNRLSTNFKKNSLLSLILILLICVYFLRLIYLNNPQIRQLFNLPKYVAMPISNPSRVGSIYISNSQKVKISSIQSFVVKNTEKQDYIFFFDDEPIMYMFTDRLNPTEYDVPFVGGTLEKRIRMLNGIIKYKPKFIFFDKDAWPVDGIPNSKRLPERLFTIKIKQGLTVLPYTVKKLADFVIADDFGIR
ncbi:MAG: DUF3488 domain-containing protein [Patescibacteria group bacterium]|nr:DUF3488 domain-containing protein [Patescibacteria group bacterium]